MGRKKAQRNAKILEWERDRVGNAHLSRTSQTFLTETENRMNESVTILLLAGLTLASVGVIAYVGRGILREMNGLDEDEDGAQAGRRTEERKNAKIAREIEQWRSGE